MAFESAFGSGERGIRPRDVHRSPRERSRFGRARTSIKDGLTFFANPAGSTVSQAPASPEELLKANLAPYPGLLATALKVLIYPDNVEAGKLTVKMDNGEAKEFPYWRIRYHGARGPGKGGIRFAPTVSFEEVRFLSFMMGLKNAIIDHPLGGGKGGVVVDTKDITPGEKERISRAYARAIEPHVGAWLDIPAPDMYTDGQVMAWILDEIEEIRAHDLKRKGRGAYHEPGMITGKPLALGGSLGRDKATARGGLFALEKLLELQGDSLAGKSVAIQGFGNAGQYAAELFLEGGGRIVAVSDSKAALHNEKGFGADTLKALAEHKKLTGSLKGFPGARELENVDDLLGLDVDVLVPSAFENSITEFNAGKVEAKIIVELANGPVSPEADALLFQKGVVLLPDFLANSGGVCVSNFERAQNLSGVRWPLEEVNSRLKNDIDNAVKAVWEVSQDGANGIPVSLRQAAFKISAERIIEAMRLRGHPELQG